MEDIQERKMSKVSVIVPVYNKEKYLQECIDSILGQTLDDKEVIFVDDGSTDSSPEILKEAAESHDNVKIITQENQYAGVARNNGLLAASGEYIHFMDADDFAEPEQLELMYEKAVEDDADICICNIIDYNDQTGLAKESKISLNYELLPEKRPFSIDDAPDRIFNVSTFTSTNKLFRRSFLMDNDIRYKPYRISEDTFFMVKSFLFAERITTVDQALVYYRHQTGISLSDDVSSDVFSNFRSYTEALDYIKETGKYDENIKRSFANKALQNTLHDFDMVSNFETFEMLYDNLIKNGGLERLGLDGADEEYIYSESRYRNLETMRTCGSAEAYMFWRYQNARERNRKKDARIIDLKEKIRCKNVRLQARAERIGRLREKINLKNESIKAKKAKIHELNDKVKEKNAKIRALRKESGDLKKKYNAEKARADKLYYSGIMGLLRRIKRKLKRMMGK